MSRLQEASAQCVTCPRLCHSACPTAEVTGSGALSGWGLANLAHAIAIDALPRSQRPAALMALGTCNACGRCASFCRSHVDVPSLVVMAKRALLASEPLPGPIRERLQEPMAHAPDEGRTTAGDWRWAPGCALGSGLDEAEVPGLEALFRVVSAEGVSRTEPWGACQGGLARTAGALPPRDEAPTRAARRVVGCLACLEDGQEPGVHWVAWLDDRRDALRSLHAATGLAPVRSVFHEGCGRGARALASAARRVLDAVGVEATPLRDSMEEPPCCGGAPLQRALHPDIADAITQQFPGVGPTVTLSSSCARHLREAKSLPIQSFAEMLLWRTGIQTEAS